jgi:hypothetical protein
MRSAEKDAFEIRRTRKDQRPAQVIWVVPWQENRDDQKNPSDCVFLQDGGDYFQGLTTMRTVFDVDIKHPLEQARPADAHRCQGRWRIVIRVHPAIVGSTDQNIIGFMQRHNFQFKELDIPEAIGHFRFSSCSETFLQVSCSRCFIFHAQT